MRLARSFKRIGFLAAMLLAVFLLCACTGETPPVVPVETPSPSPALTVQIEILPSASPSPTPVPPALDLAPYQVAESNAFYDILPLLHREGRTLIHIGFAGENTLLVMSTDDSKTLLFYDRFDLVRGVFTEQYVEELPYVLDNAFAYTFYADDPLLYYDSAADEIVAFLPDGHKRVRISTNGRMFGACFPAEGGFLTFDNLSRTLLHIGYDGTETVRFAFDYRWRYAGLLSVSADGRIASFSATDGRTGEEVTVLIDVQTGTPIGQAEGRVYCQQTEAGFSMLTYRYIWDEDHGTTTLAYRAADTLDAGEYAEVSDIETDYYPTVFPVPNHYIYEDWYGSYRLTFTDATGQVQRRTDVPIPAYQSIADARRAEAPVTDNDFEEYEDGDADLFLYPETCADCSDGQFVVTTVRIDGEIVGVLLWDTERTEPEQRTPMTQVGELFSPVWAPQGGEEFAARMQQIYDAYGISVLIGDDAQLTVSSHTAERIPVAENRAEYEAALDTLESTLADYPPQFFQTLCRGDLGGIVVELCGEIRAVNEFSLDYPAALTSQADQYRLIICNIYDALDFRYTLFHEIAHMIDGRLDSLSSSDDSHWNDAAWDALNPDGFSYYFAYNDAKGRPFYSVGSSDYTDSDSRYLKKGNRNRVYFVDIYSKTFPTEDRAVLMGTLLNHSALDGLLSCPHLTEKLAYYVRAIRYYFDPDGTLWPEPTIWERRLDDVQQAG